MEADSLDAQQQAVAEQPNEGEVVPALPTPTKKTRGPAPKMDDHRKVADVVRPYGDHWRDENNLQKIVATLDGLEVPIPPTWPNRKDKSHNWERALENYSRLVIQAIEYRCKAALR